MPLVIGRILSGSPLGGWLGLTGVYSLFNGAIAMALKQDGFGSIKKGDQVFLVYGRACSSLTDVYMSENDAQDTVMRIIFSLDNDGNGEKVEPYYVKKLMPNQRRILKALRDSNVEFDVLLDYYNSVAGEDDRWFVSRTVLR